MKNLEKTEVHLFRFDEVKHLEEVDLRQLKKFTFAPCTPLFLYHFFQKGYDFIILQLTFFLCYAAYLLISLKSSTIFTLRKMQPLLAEGVITQEVIETMKSVKNLDSPFGPTIGKWGLLGSSTTLAIVNLAIFFIGYVGITCFVGIHSKKMAWNRNEWKDVTAFEKSQQRWHWIGLITYALVCFFLGSLIPRILNAK